MDPTPPPPPPPHSSSSSATAATSFVGGHSTTPRGSMPSAFLLGTPTTSAHPQSRRRSSLYPPPLPIRRISSRGSDDTGSGSSSRSRPAAGGRRSPTAALYEELCAIRSSSSEFIARMDAMVEAHRASSRPPRRRQQATSSSGLVPPLLPDLASGGYAPTGNISAGYAPAFSLGTSPTSGQPDLRSRSFSGYASPSLPQQQQNAWPSSSTTFGSGLTDLPRGSFFGGYTPSFSVNQQQQASPSSLTTAGLPPLPGSCFPAFAQQQPSAAGASYHHQQQQLRNSGGESTTLLPGFSSSWSSSSDNVPPSWTWPSSTTTTSGTPLETSPALMASLLEPSPSLESRLPLLDSSSSGDMQSQLGGNGDQLMMSSWGGQTWSPVPEDVVNSFGVMSIGGSNTSTAGCGSMDWNAQSSLSSMQQQVPWQGGTFASPSSDLSQHWQPSSQSTTTPQQFMQLTSAGFELPPFPPSLDMGLLPVGNSTSCATDVLQYGNINGPITWNAASTGGNSDLINCGSMQGAASNCDAISGSNNSNKPWQSHSSSSMESSTAIPQLRPRSKESQRVSRRAPSPVGGASSNLSRVKANGNLFTDTETEKIMKDKRLKELVSTNPKRVKRIISNRASSAKMKAQKENCLRDLERQFEALQVDNIVLSSQVRSEQEKFIELKNQNNRMRMRLQQLEVQAKMSQVESQALQAEIDSLKLVELSGLYTSDVHLPMSSHMEHEISCYTDSLHKWNGP